MRQLTLREWDRVGVGPGELLSEHEAAGLAALSVRLPKGALTFEHRGFRFGPFCGVVRTADLTIELLPKIDRGDDQASGVLVGMLAAVGQLRINDTGEAGLRTQRVHLLDVFIEDFCRRVHAALRGGAIARYVVLADDLPTVRGRLRITDHLRRNPAERARLACEFDERTIDNLHNRLLKAALRHLVAACFSPRTRTLVATLVHRFGDVTDRPVTAADLDGLVFDRMTRHWESVFVRAAWLMSGLFPDVRSGEAQASALLFDMQRLFEDVLGRRMQQAAAAHDLALRVDCQGPQRQLAEDAFLLRPDVTISDGDRVVAIVDAKWKRLRTDEPNAGVSSGDAYQMTAYAGRYGCRRLALVYPASRHLAPGILHTFKLRTERRPELTVYAIDVADLALHASALAGPTNLLRRLGVREPT